MLQYFETYQQRLGKLKDKASRQETSYVLIKLESEDLFDVVANFKKSLKEMGAHEELVARCNPLLRQIAQFILDLEGLIEMQNENRV